MRVLQELNTIYQLLFRSIKGESHAERIEDFYRGQAERYDAFREQLLYGRRELLRALPFVEGGVWVDVGGGTGWSVEQVQDKIERLSQVYIVDVSASLLAVAQDKIDTYGWTNVTLVNADVADFTPPEGQVDQVTFSYSLTMIPNWFSALERAHQWLREGGRLGVVDFYLSRKYPHHSEGARHGLLERLLWISWFYKDGVRISTEHLPYLLTHFESEILIESRSSIPYVPLLKTPYYQFIGRKVGQRELEDTLS